MTANQAAVGSVFLIVFNKPDVPIHVYKAVDTNGSALLEVNADERQSGAVFDLYVNGAVSPSASVTTSLSGIQDFASFDVLGGAPVGAGIVMCETPPAGFSLLVSNFNAAPDPEGLGRKCVASTVTANQAAVGSVFLIVFNKPNAVTPPLFTKEFAPASVPAGQPSTLTFTITNTANGFTGDTLSFTDVLPAGLIVADPPNQAQTCAGGTTTAAPGSATFSYAGGSVPPGST